VRAIKVSRGIPSEVRCNNDEKRGLVHLGGYRREDFKKRPTGAYRRLYSEKGKSSNAVAARQLGKKETRRPTGEGAPRKGLERFGERREAFEGGSVWRREKSVSHPEGKKTTRMKAILDKVVTPAHQGQFWKSGERWVPPFTKTRVMLQEHAKGNEKTSVRAPQRGKQGRVGPKTRANLPSPGWG